jgi:hypothetical protein
MAGLDKTKLGMVATMALGAACSSAGGAGASDGSTGTVTHPHTTTTSMATTGTGGTSATTGAGGMGGSAPTCNPPAAAGSFWALTGQTYGDPNPTSMCDYRGDVLLVVNTADV